jgi:hypothetical protein
MLTIIAPWSRSTYKENAEQSSERNLKKTILQTKIDLQVSSAFSLKPLKA